jgi:arylsulfatase A-like enzyme
LSDREKAGATTEHAEAATVNAGATRREFLQGSLAVAGTLAATSTRSLAAQTKPKRPNLLFLFGEGHRADCLSIAGHPLLKTPNHDRIGSEGVRFTNAFCTNSLCAPARATVLTGLWSRTSGMLDNKLIDEPMPSDIPIFTDLLHEAGYDVAMVGKAHVRNGVKERYWDYYFGFNAPNTNYYAPKFIEGRKGQMGPETTYHGYADDVATDRALAWLAEDRGDRPFCLLLWFQTPHAPFYRERRHLNLYNGVPIPVPVTFDDDLKGYPGKPKAFADAANKIGTIDTQDRVRSLEELCKDYYAGLVAVDDDIGRVFQHLEAKGQMDETAVLHSSDHGYFLGEWRMFDKRLMHEPSIRVPMMLRYPKRIQPGVVREEMVLDVDIAPTLMDLAGVKAPAAWQGESLMKLPGTAKPKWRDEWLYDYYEYPGYEDVKPHRGVRTATHKLIDWYTTPGTFEMYDLVSDPLERNNLYGDPAHAALQHKLHAQLDRLLKATPVRRDEKQS